MGHGKGAWGLAWGVALLFLAGTCLGAQDDQGRPTVHEAGPEKEAWSPRFPVLCWELMDQDVYVYDHNMGSYNWRQIREKREIRLTANQRTKQVRLQLISLGAGRDATWKPGQDLVSGARLLLRDPDGNLTRLHSLAGQGELLSIPVGVPKSGRYMVAAHLELDQPDDSRQGPWNTLHLYAKQFIGHYDHDLPMGSSPNVFFNDPGRVTLEIGPVVINAKRKFGGDMQRPHQEYEMMVKYKNKPLPGARVFVYVQGGDWLGRFTTGDDGIFTIVPPDDRPGNRAWQKHIYVAEHYDALDRSYHVATFPVIVTQNRPEWRSKAMGFSLWTIIGSALTILIVVGLSWRKKRQDRRSLVVFESCRIKKD